MKEKQGMFEMLMDFAIQNPRSTSAPVSILQSFNALVPSMLMLCALYLTQCNHWEAKGSGIGALAKVCCLGGKTIGHLLDPKGGGVIETELSAR